MRQLLLFLFLLLFIHHNGYSQSLFGLSSELNETLFRTNDLDTKQEIGFGERISTLLGLHKSADLISVIIYTSPSISLLGNENNLAEIKDTTFSIANFNVNFFHNQYLILPGGYEPHLAIQTGSSLSKFKGWRRKDELEADQCFVSFSLTHFLEPFY